jgi:tetratricopeptide (TPR) repeat protein
VLPTAGKISKIESMKRRGHIPKSAEMHKGGKVTKHLRQELIVPLTRSRRRFFSLAALVLAPLLAFGLLEGALRVSGFGYDTAFFKRARINDRDFLINNDSFILRFFPPQLARRPEPLRMEACKPANTCRIFILGESAALGDPSPSYGAWRYLQTMLSDEFPDEKFEVVNVSITAINSHVLLPIARECASHQGDFWIIYMGNNEMVGPFGAASVFGARASPIWMVRLSLALQSTRVGQGLMTVVRNLTFKSANVSSWRGMEMFLGRQVPPDDLRRERVYRNFQRNLRDILQSGLQSGAHVVLNTVAVNLKDCSPFASIEPARLPAAERASFQSLAADAVQARQQNRYQEAANEFAQAAELQPRAADLQYHWAQCLWGMTNFTAAKEHFQKACDYDALPFRADSRINELIRQAARQSSNSNLLMFDAAATLASGGPGEICGDETFFEHVHFNFDGNYRLARAWAGLIAPLVAETGRTKRKDRDWLSQAICEQRLGLTDWNRKIIAVEELRRRMKPPLNGQANNGWEMKALTNELDLLQRQMDGAAAARARALFLDDLQHDPDDFLLLFNFGDFLQEIKDWKDGIAVWRQAQSLVPHYYLCYFQEGRMLENDGQLDEAESAFRRAVALNPRMAAAWFELSSLHTSEGRYEIARQELERAMRLKPGQPTYYICLGALLARMNRHSAAIEQFRQAIQIEPDHWDVHLALAQELCRASRMAEATSEFREVVLRCPDRIQAHLDLGSILNQQGLHNWARQQFQEVLRLDPSNQAARQALDFTSK